MRRAVERTTEALTPLGYRRRKNAFFRVDQGLLRLIDLQKSSQGEYFFVNLCIHPLGLPKLQTRLVVPKEPVEYECILRQRVEQAVKGSPFVPRGGLFKHEDLDLDGLERLLTKPIQDWFDHWCDWDQLAAAEEASLAPMLTVVPILKHKAFLMLKYFCLLRTDVPTSKAVFQEYLAIELRGLDFSEVDCYLAALPQHTVVRAQST